MKESCGRQNLASLLIAMQLFKVLKTVDLQVRVNINVYGLSLGLSGVMVHRATVTIGNRLFNNDKNGLKCSIRQ